MSVANIRGEVRAFPDRAETLLVPVEREHSWAKCLFMSAGISMCITVDILQHSMPLAFLPSVLEDRGHSPFKIATALGVYYWTGFLGCSIITGFQVWRMFYQRSSNESEDTDYSTVLRYIKYLIIALGVGALTLFAQAMEPTWSVHFGCRFIQGFAGAFIFFYTALLNVALFMDKQQDVAVTIAACALNVAEVLGSFLGAVMFDRWGQGSVFYFLAVVSVVNQVVLVAVMYMVEPAKGQPSRQNSLRPFARSNSLLSSPLLDESMSREMSMAESGGGPSVSREQDQRMCGCLPKVRKGSWNKLKGIFSHPRLVSAVMLIAMSSVVKGAIEEMLPFHADHRWGYDPLKIGELFLIIAMAFIVSAVAVCFCWHGLEGFHIQFSAVWLLLLGIVAWSVFAMVSLNPAYTTLALALVGYGVCMGLTNTPANLLAASVIDIEKGAAKDAANGIFQTMWEAGGSLGFLLGGAFAERYHEQMGLLTGCAIFCAITAVAMFLVSGLWPEDQGDDDDESASSSCSATYAKISFKEEGGY